MAIVSVKKLSQLEGQKRIDAEYYQPEYSLIRQKLNEIETRRVKELSTSVVSFGAYSLCNYIEWRKEGVPYLNVENIRDGYIDFEEVKRIDDNVNEILKKSQVREGQVLLTMAGTIGNAAVAYKLPGKVNSNQATAKITLKPGVSPFFITAFLNSYFGRKQTEWEIVTSVQPNIFLWQIENIRVPLVSKELEHEIEAIYREALDKLGSSKSFYSQAENLLIKKLGLKGFKPNYELSYRASLSKAFGVHRVDAEYFQPKYEALIDSIKQFQLAKLGQLARRTVTKLKPEDDVQYKYIEINDVEPGIGEINYTERLGKELPPNARIPINGGELIISKVRPTRGAISIVPIELRQNVICSSAFSVFRAESPLKEYLYITTRSMVGKLQMERPTTGTSYPTIRDADVEDIQIPIVSEEVQQRISSLVLQSHEARKKAKELLEEAKSKVENLIEGKA